MAFLDNSGDIILDAVLTDTGRYRLAKGDGSFKIVKYAFGDDEINYALYRNTNHQLGSHVSGSAYYDLDILQTPVLEAFTNNTSLMKSKLISIPQNNLTHLPVVMLNKFGATAAGAGAASEVPYTGDTFYVAVDSTTQDRLGKQDGIMFGFDRSEGNPIQLDQGLNTLDLSPASGLSSVLTETQYIIELDHRLASIYSETKGLKKVSFIDDDFVASYYFSRGTDSPVVQDLTYAKEAGTVTPILGPRGTMLRFLLGASTNLQTTDFLFDKIGGGTTSTVTITQTGAGYIGTQKFKYIDTNIRVTGATTGYRVEIPIRFIKYNSAIQ